MDRTKARAALDEATADREAILRWHYNRLREPENKWLTSHGAVFAPVTADVEEIAHDCGTSTSTAYEALARLQTLQLVEHPDPSR
ncbi:hypothetical protein [Kitasatospora sp. NPDC001547]|uniref:hypothetical protein n=1 Tax=Kitasatospora sp. NPDC001547 TaxID=3364015 RepID=UPI0036AC31E2